MQGDFGPRRACGGGGAGRTTGACVRPHHPTPLYANGTPPSAGGKVVQLGGGARQLYYYPKNVLQVTNVGDDVNKSEGPLMFRSWTAPTSQCDWGTAGMSQLPHARSLGRSQLCEPTPRQRGRRPPPPPRRPHGAGRNTVRRAHAGAAAGGHGPLVCRRRLGAQRALCMPCTQAAYTRCRTSPHASA